MSRFLHSIAPWLAAAALTLPYGGIARAETRLELGALADIAPVGKSVRTLRDLRYRDMIRQRYDFSCGSAALGSLLRYGYGMDVTEPQMIQAMLKTGSDPQDVVRNGFSMLDMKRYVDSIGLRAHGFRVPAEALYRLQVPVIALLDLKGYKHFVLVKGAQAGRVFVADPALGHRVMNERDFVAGWNGVLLAVVGDRPIADSYLVSGRSSLALGRRLEVLDRATLPVPVVELGLVRADLF